jgi:hypothetical protein
MKILTVCSSPYTSLESITRILDQAGLDQGKESSHHQSYQQWHHQVFDAYEQDMTGLLTEKLLQPGKVWQNMASELVYANLDKKQWYWSDSKAAWLLDFWSDLEPQHRFALIYSPPQLGISQGILHPDTQNVALETVIKSWIQYNTELLRYYHQHKDKCILVNVEQCLANPNEFITLCQQSFGLTFNKQTLVPELKPNHLQSLETELFGAILKEYPQIEPLYQELKTSATLFPQPIPHDETIDSKEYADILWCHYKKIIQTTQRNFILKTQNPQELDSLKHNIKDLTKKTKKLETEKASLNKQIATSNKALQEKITALETEKIAFEKKKATEHQALLEKLKEEQQNKTKELETHFLKSQSLEKQKSETDKVTQDRIKKLESEKASLNKQIATSNKALQEKITALETEKIAFEKKKVTEHQALLKKLKAEQQNKTKEAESENELMLLQLHQVQEELEHYFLKYQELENSHQNKPILGLITSPLENDFFRAQVIQVEQTSLGLGVELINLQSSQQLWKSYQLTLIKSASLDEDDITQAALKLPLQDNNLLPLQTWPPQVADDKGAYWLIDLRLLEKESMQSYLHPEDINFLYYLVKNISLWLKALEVNYPLQHNDWDEYYETLNILEMKLYSIVQLHQNK